MQPYYADDKCQLYLGKMEEILPALAVTVDACVTDPPYGETSLAWDGWLHGWPTLVADTTNSMWCFGSMRMFLERGIEFSGPGWKLSQDIVWEKQNGSGFYTDRFKRVHEHALHWYTGPWRNVRHEVPLTGAPEALRIGKRNALSKETHGARSGSSRVHDGRKLTRSVIQVRNLNRISLHPTEKPTGILQPLIEYACPPGGLVLDPFAGSGSTLATAKAIGRRAIGIEGDEKYAEIIAKRLCQDPLDFDEVT